MEIIVGSFALKHWVLSSREPLDKDIWTDEKNIVGKNDISLIPLKILNLVEEEDGIATLNSLYTIKCSHLGWDILFEKHKKDIYFMKCIGAKIIPELFYLLKEYWKSIHKNNNNLSLYKTKEEFFTDHVEYHYDHDYLHELVSYPNHPIYKSCLKDNEEIFIDEEKFNLLSFENKVRMFREEITVIACERWIIPERYDINWMTSHRYSLRKTITSLTKNWASDFIILNLKYFIKPDFSYFNHILTTIKEGKKEMSKQVNNQKELFTEIQKLSSSKEGYKGFLSELLREDISIEGVEMIEIDGGGEGGSESCYTVFLWEEKYYKSYYSYYSYDGFDFGNITTYIVEPKQKTITSYE